LFATVNSTSPAGTLAGLGAQPCGVNSIVTVVWPGPDTDTADLCGLAQPDAASASPAATAAAALTGAQRGRRVLSREPEADRAAVTAAGLVLVPLVRMTLLLFRWLWIQGRAGRLCWRARPGWPRGY
jgi:hypothetical protein